MNNYGLTDQHITPVATLTDEAVDRILAGEMAPPAYRPWGGTQGGPTAGEMPMRKRRCAICGLAGHNRSTCR